MVWFYPGFHDGQLCDEDETFNPTMVWFYHTKAYSSFKQKQDFQSHYGLILSVSTAFLQLVLFNPFNPTMVWFYLFDYFDDGTKVNDLSIPLWSDFITVNVVDTGNAVYVFQSHYGLILSFA